MGWTGRSPLGGDESQHDGKGEAGEHARLFGRHKGKRLRAGQQKLMEDLLPRLRVPLPDRDALPGAEAIDPSALFAFKPDAVWLEIGYGGGEHLAAQAGAHPGVGFIGCEFFLNGIAKLLRRIDEEGLENIRLHDRDARDVLSALAPASIDRAFLLFPDPWPKTRHHGRRFIQRESLDGLARILKPGAQFRVATDIPAYMRWTLMHLMAHPDFLWDDEAPGDWRVRRADWPGTRYEAKALREGRTPVYLTFRRR
ncbi:MAG: tRNA (guanine(46)-N(7))-methyltransferase TrmB [Alphaproteobacteria bacterium]